MSQCQICLPWSSRRLQNHRLLDIHRRSGPDVLYLARVVVAKVVVAKAVGFRIEDVFKVCLEPHPLRRIDVALEDRILDADAEVLASLRNAPQPPLPGGVGSGDIIAYEH